MAEEREESPQQTPHFTTDDASDAGPDTPSVAPDDIEGSSEPDRRPQAGDFGSDDEINKTATEDAKSG